MLCRFSPNKIALVCGNKLAMLSLPGPSDIAWAVRRRATGKHRARTAGAQVRRPERNSALVNIRSKHKCQTLVPLLLNSHLDMPRDHEHWVAGRVKQVGGWRTLRSWNRFACVPRWRLSNACGLDGYMGRATWRAFTIERVHA